MALSRRNFGPDAAQRARSRAIEIYFNFLDFVKKGRSKKRVKIWGSA